MDNLQLQTACPNYQSHLRLSAGVTCCSHALQCTGASIPPCISSAEHLNWGSAPRDRNSELRKSTAKHLPPAPQGGKAKHKSSRIRAAIGANGSLLLLTFLRGALQISTCAAFHGALQPGWLRRLHSIQMVHDIFISWNPTALHTKHKGAQPETKHSSVHVQRPTQLFQICCFPPQGLRQTQPKNKSCYCLMVRNSFRFPCYTLYFALSGSHSSISLCFLCLSQHLDETPGTGVATPRLACTVQQEHIYCFFLLINTRVKAKNRGKA